MYCISLSLSLVTRNNFSRRGFEGEEEGDSHRSSHGCGQWVWETTELVKTWKEDHGGPTVVACPYPESWVLHMIPTYSNTFHHLSPSVSILVICIPCVSLNLSLHLLICHSLFIWIHLCPSLNMYLYIYLTLSYSIFQSIRPWPGMARPTLRRQRPWPKVSATNGWDTRCVEINKLSHLYVLQIVYKLCLNVVFLSKQIV